MCGILLIAGLEPAAAIANAGQQVARQRPDTADFHAAMSARGPDHIGQLEATWQAPDSSLLRMQLLASLLQLRGSSPSSSPLTDAQGNILCFNGELFGGLEVPQGQNDGHCLLEALATCSCTAEVVGLLSRLRGPWALLYWQAAAETLWFGRDVIGRRSLLLHLPDVADPRLLLSSVSPTIGLEPRRGPTPTTTAAADVVTATERATEAATACAAAQAADTNAAQPCCGDAAGDRAMSLQAGGDFWAELPPGLYSITAADLAGSLASCTGGDLWQRVQRYAWHDPLLQRLQQYRRDEAMLAAPQLPPLSSQGPNKTKAQRPGQQQQQQQQPQQEQQPTVQQQQEEQQRALEAGAVLVLEALRQAVRTRCCCIEGHNTSTPTSTATADGAHGHLPSPQQQQVATADGHQQQQQAVLQHARTQQPQHVHTPESRMLSPAPVLVLFSGGVDSMLLAALAHEALPPGVPLELANVCFDAGRSPDRLAARAGLEELARFGPDREWRLIEVNATLADMDAHSSALLQLLRPAGTVMDLNIGTALWLAARAEGELCWPQCGQNWHAGYADGSAPLANGIRTGCCGSAGDVADALIPVGQSVHGHGSSACGDSCIDGAKRTSTEEHSQQQPDNQAHVHTMHNIITQHKQRVPQAQQLRQPCLQPQPPPQQPQLHRSAARVVLLGHGADEQCGGYGRHRTSFRVGSWQGLGREMELDVKRLWLRNLGRDDRLVADHGREARHPFLDEGVLDVVLSLPLALVADLRNPPGVGDKRLLREALRQLGLHEAAVREKRAIQFGTRIGKLSNIRHFGSGQAANKRNAGSITLDNLAIGSVTAAEVQLNFAEPVSPDRPMPLQLATAQTLA